MNRLTFLTNRFRIGPPVNRRTTSTVRLTTPFSIDARASPSASRNIAVLGGGLAGLSTVYHLINLSCELDSISITVFDPKPVGTGGASAVSGGLLHPLSPRGKIVYEGLAGVKASNRLVKVAVQAATLDNKIGVVVLRDELYRVATTPQECKVLEETSQLPELNGLATWIPDYGSSMGALRLHSGGCQVIHVPAYLQGLWKACQFLCNERNQSSLEWKSISPGVDARALTDNFDTILLAGGSGLFSTWMCRESLPVQFVRGQSLEINVPYLVDGCRQDARLCGKYVSPSPDPETVLIGATHEFHEIPLPETEVVQLLKERTWDIAKDVWEHGTVRRITSGTRVQSDRDTRGRLPIVGRWPSTDTDSCSGSNPHSNIWIFTGLSSRGLLYHGLYGERLANNILINSHDFIAKTTTLSTAATLDR